MSTPDKYILQLTGMAGTGKSSVAKKLSEEYDFKVVTVSAMLGVYARSSGMPHNTRDDLRAAHAHWVENDPLAIPRMICELPNDRICVDGIRVPAHAVALCRASDIGYENVESDIFWLDGPSAKERYERCLRRNDPKSNPPTFAEFEQSEAPDVLSSDPYSPSLLGMFCLANYTIPNSDFSTSYSEIKELLQANCRIEA